MKQKAVISLCDKTGLMMKPWAEAGYTCYAVDVQHKQRSDRTELFEGGGRIKEAKRQQALQEQSLRRTNQSKHLLPIIN